MAIVYQDTNQLQMEQFCEKILKISNVRFAGLSAILENCMQVGSRKTMIQKKDDGQKQLMYMKFALESYLGKDFDESLGEFRLSVIHRKNTQILTMNIYSYLLLVFMDTQCDTNTLSKRIQEMIDENYVNHV